MTNAKETLLHSEVIWQITTDACSAGSASVWTLTAGRGLPGRRSPQPSTRHLLGNPLSDRHRSHIAFILPAVERVSGAKSNWRTPVSLPYHDEAYEHGRHYRTAALSPAFHPVERQAERRSSRYASPLQLARRPVTTSTDVYFLAMIPHRAHHASLEPRQIDSQPGDLVVKGLARQIQCRDRGANIAIGKRESVLDQRRFEFRDLCLEVL